MIKKLILHAGCGNTALPEWLDGAEVRLDIDPVSKPDIVASLTDMGQIGGFDAVYCCHVLEHLYPRDIPKALGECLRVLKPGGAVLIRVPDLEDVKPTEEVIYQSPAGPVCGLDMYYGMRRLIDLSPHMAHHWGFVKATLHRELEGAGFEQVHVKRVAFGAELFGVGVKGGAQ